MQQLFLIILQKCEKGRRIFFKKKLQRLIILLFCFKKAKNKSMNLLKLQNF